MIRAFRLQKYGDATFAGSTSGPRDGSSQPRRTAARRQRPNGPNPPRHDRLATKTAAPPAPPSATRQRRPAAQALIMAQLGLDYPTEVGPGLHSRASFESCTSTYYIVPVPSACRRSRSAASNTSTGAGPFIFVANHTSNLDTPLVLSALPPAERKRTVVAAAMDNFFMESRQGLSRRCCLFNAIPIDRHKVNRRSAQQALELVQDHWNLLIYPEGGRSPDGALQEFKGGAAYLADRAKATVIPTYIHESGMLRGPKYAKAPQFVNAPNKRRHHVIVAFGEACTLRRARTSDASVAHRRRGRSSSGAK